MKKTHMIEIATDEQTVDLKLEKTAVTYVP